MKDNNVEGEIFEELPKPKSNSKKIIIGIIGLLVICCLGAGVFGSLLSSDSDDQTTSEDSTQQQESTTIAAVETTKFSEPTDISAITSTAGPTNTPAPTNTPEPTNTPKPTNTPTPMPIGLSRENPFPITELVSVPNWEVQVIETKRGDEAWQDIQIANMFNDPAPEGMEYLLVKVHVKSTYDDSEEHNIGGCDFDVTGDNLTLYTCSTASVVEPDPQLDANLFTGGEAEGWMAYLVAEGERNLMLIVNEVFNFDSDAIRYIALDEAASLTVPSELRGIEPTDYGTERNNPATLEDKIITENWEISVIDVVRGDDAWAMVLEANQFNDPPEEGMEYIAIKLHVRNIGTKDEAENIDISSFNTTGDAGVLYDPAYAVAPDPRLDAYLFPGGELEGWIVVQVAKDETGILLVFDPIWDFGGSNKRFISLE